VQALQFTITTTELALPQRQIALEQLPLLGQLGRVEDGIFYLERSPRNHYSLKTGPVKVPLDKLLGLGQKGLAEYIITALVSQRPKLIPWVLENESLVNLAKHMLRSKSGSLMGFYGYTSSVDLYCRRLHSAPDQVIADTKPNIVNTDAARLEKHRRFLQDCLAEMQDRGISPGRLHGYSRHVRTWYRVNDVEIKPPSLPQPRVVYKDRAPTLEELQRILDVADLRERVIVTMLVLAVFREGTLVRLEYHHVKADLERGVVPVHVHVDADETKGKYCDYDTFLGQEAVEYLRLYLDKRREGSPDGKVQPEKITDNSPLIRDPHAAIPKPIGEKAIYRLIHNLYHRAGLLKAKDAKTGRFDIRVHSLRKTFKTQMKALGVDGDYIDYMMGHVVDTYHDIQSKGIEFLRNVYAKADYHIRRENKTTPKEMLKRMVRSIGLDPEKVLSREALGEPHRIYATPQEREKEETTLLVKAFVDSIKTQLQDSTVSQTRNSQG